MSRNEKKNSFNRFPRSGAEAKKCRCQFKNVKIFIPLKSQTASEAHEVGVMMKSNITFPMFGSKFMFYFLTAPPRLINYQSFQTTTDRPTIFLLGKQIHLRDYVGAQTNKLVCCPRLSQAHRFGSHSPMQSYYDLITLYLISLRLLNEIYALRGFG